MAFFQTGTAFFKLHNFPFCQEIVQNAEDAGAKVVKFLYDENSEETIFDQGKEELKVCFNFKLMCLFHRH